MCRNYVKKYVNESNIGTLGYIPFTEYTVNTFDTLGTPIDDTEANWPLSGKYAQCGDDIICNTTFQGGYSSDSRDPQTWGDFQEVKSRFSPTWTGVDLNYMDGTLFIQYNKPFFSEQSLNDTDKFS